MPKNILIVIPARGGSKGIPRKNLRALAGRPLLYYTIRMASGSRYVPDVFVSSEDDEIRMVAGKLGARVIDRDPSLSQDEVTLDGVIHDAMVQAEKLLGKRYDLVITAQPTAPLLETATLDAAIERTLAEPSIDTMISAVDDRHLCWEMEGDRLVPAYEERLNRQYLPVRFRETGGFFIARRRVVFPHSRFGDNVEVWPLTARESIDIDTFADWALCEFYLRRKRIVLVAAGHPEIGLGHAYNLLAVAGGILDHDLQFVVDADSQLAHDTIASFNYPVAMAPQGQLAEFVATFKPDVIINDRLDTDLSYMDSLCETKATLVNFEDLGPGAARADLVINAMYPEKIVRPNHHFGHHYFCLRSEFLLTEETVSIRREVKSVLLSFGGVDPNNLTLRVLEAILPECRRRGIRIRIVLGRGYQAEDSLRGLADEVAILRDVGNMSDHMLWADLAFTSAGRTTFETASVGLPTIVLCQNEREQTHFFATANYGFVNLGLGARVSQGDIESAFITLADDPEQRRYMASLMRPREIKAGHHNVLRLLKQTINEA